METASMTDDIKGKARELGYDLCGTIPAGAVKDYAARLDKRIERFPHSRRLYEKLYDLSSPEKKAPWAKSIIVCVRRYSKYKVPSEASKYFGKVYLFDGRLPCSEEYRNAILFEEYLLNLGLEVARDIAPARWAAVSAGLGHFGHNNFLYTRYGSWVWIDTWTVNVELKYDGPVAAVQTCPENCGRCIAVCPTQALSAPYAMDRGSCIAHLSFFSSTLPAEHMRERMGTWLYGCDICQDVCPKNRHMWDGREDFPELESIVDLLAPEKILEMDEKTFLEVIQPRFWYIGKESIWLWKCNALRAMANSGDPRYHECIRRACREEDENVRAMALWACNKLGI